MNALLLNKNSDTFRYERKFIISQLDRHHVETLIKNHPAMFSEIFHERSVNNIYFDTHQLKHYFLPNQLDHFLKFQIILDLIAKNYDYPQA